MGGLTITELGSLGEFIGAFAVVASLIYVGIQLRQNTATERVRAAQTFTDTFNASLRPASESPVIADIIYRGTQGISNLTPSEHVQFFAFFSQTFTGYHSYFVQRQRGFLDEEYWTCYVAVLTDLMAMKGVQEYWERRKHWYSKDFRDYVTELSGSGVGRQMYPILEES